MRICVCIPVFNRLALTRSCLQSLAKQDYRNFATIVCDDGSTDGTAEILRAEFPWVTVLHGDGSLWWSGGTNRCIQHVLDHQQDDDTYILLLNNDLELPPDYLTSLVRAANRHPRAIISSTAYDIITNERRPTGFRQSWWLAKEYAVVPERDCTREDADVSQVTHVPGRGTLIPLDCCREIGLFDARYLPHYGADYDFTHRARRAGYQILVCFSARVFTHAGETGLTSQHRAFSARGLYWYLTEMKSPANLRVRFRFALNNCPVLLLPSFLFLDFLRIIGSYFRLHLRQQ